MLLNISCDQGTSGTSLYSKGLGYWSLSSRVFSNSSLHSINNSVSDIAIESIILNEEVIRE